MPDYKFTVVVEQDEDGLYVASVPLLQGCHTQGETYEEALANIKDAEVGFKGIRQFPCKYVPAVPINNGDQVQKSFYHRDIRDVRRPDLIWTCNLHIVKQVGIDLVPCRRTACPGTPVNRLDPHEAH